MTFLFIRRLLRRKERVLAGSPSDHYIGIVLFVKHFLIFLALHFGLSPIADMLKGLTITGLSKAFSFVASSLTDEQKIWQVSIYLSTSRCGEDRDPDHGHCHP